MWPSLWPTEHLLRLSHGDKAPRWGSAAPGSGVHMPSLLTAGAREGTACPARQLLAVDPGKHIQGFRPRLGSDRSPVGSTAQTLCPAPGASESPCPVFSPHAVGGPRGRCHSRLEHCDRLVFHRPSTQEIAAARASDGSCQASPQGVREGSDGRPRGSEDRPAAAAPLVACWCPRRWARPVRAGRSTRGLCARPHCCRVTCRTLILRVQRLH